MAVSPYTRERLTEAANASRTLTEALEKLDVDPKSGSRQHIRARMKRLGVDTSHFEREGLRWTRAALEEAVSASANMCEVLRRLGVDVVGGQHTHISRRVRELRIDTSHFKAESRVGVPRSLRAPEAILVQQQPEQARRIQSDRLRAGMAALGVEALCAECGIATWMGEPLPLEIDHINGDWRDNRPENLRFLCPNCHSATDTYRGRGKARRR
ncbi:HNH endonuclease signature motif containing protein [Streptomyces sp. NPDC002082]|uniref:HNH endonuclease signature motif containing protein n=1 Tax=Streptomyces sp. NPDC002082 TaxID=3154772 RepID=UPI00332DB567